MRRERKPFPPERQPAAKPKRKAAPRPAEVAARQAEGHAHFLETHDVSRETLARLDQYVALLTEWQRRINLVAPATIGDVWARHIADSLVLERLLPPFQHCVDLGSGAGLPGLVVAAARAEQGGVVDLVESNAKKAAFLRAVQRGLGLDGTVHAARIEDCGAALVAADLVTARALAPLPELLAMVAPHIRTSARCFFQKGRSHEQEINQAAAHWRFTVVKHESNLEDGSVILDIGDIARR